MGFMVQLNTNICVSTYSQTEITILPTSNSVYAFWLNWVPFSIFIIIFIISKNTKNKKKQTNTNITCIYKIYINTYYN